MLQRKQPGTDPSGEANLPRWLLAALGVQAALLLFLGMAFLINPDIADLVWPWQLTWFDKAYSTAWLMGFGVMFIQMLYEKDFGRVRPGLIASVGLGILQIVAIIRYYETVHWKSPQAWAYIAFLLSLALAGAIGLILDRLRHRKQ